MPKEKKTKFKIEAEIVRGECPTCSEITTLVGISSQFFRCMECGGDLEQHVNGKISYIPIMPSSKDGTKLYVKEWK
jgi:ribosomal protein S27E